ncbi:MAG: YfhO family protein [candidate division Zixibacteria bacterium]|nr:YfhO family protein [candidate division Zixibacteria bacterium]
MVIGLLISAIQFYPGYVYTTEYSPRADTKRGYEWATSWSMNAEEAFSQVVPEFSGTNEGEGNYYWGKNAFKDNSEYLGVIPIFLAFIGLFFGRRKKAIFFGALAAFMFIYALGGSTPLFKLFYYVIPKVKSLRAPSTIMFVTLFSISLLAGMGLQFIIDKSRQLSADKLKKFKIYLIGVPSFILLLALLFSAAGESMLSFYCSIFYGGIESELIGQGNYTKWNLAMMNLPNITSGFWMIFLFLALVSGTIMLYLRKSFGVIILLLIPLLIMIDGIRFDSRFISTYDHTREFSPNALTDYIKTLPGKFRVANFRVLSQNMLPYHGIEVVTGYHGNQLRWYDDLLGGPGSRNFQNPNFLNLVGAKYLLAPNNAGIPLDYFGQDSLKVDREFGNVALFRNDNALPRAFFVNNYQVIADRQDIYPLVLSGNENLKSKVLLEEKPSIEIGLSDTTHKAISIDVYSADSILISVNNDSNSLLVLTDNYYRFWEAWVDGNKTKILRANGSFRAVPVPAGSQKILFKYNRDGNSLAAMATMLTLLLVAIILAGYLWLYIKSKREEAVSI